MNPDFTKKIPKIFFHYLTPIYPNRKFSGLLQIISGYHSIMGDFPQFFSKNFLWFFLTNTLFKGLSPLFDCQYVIYGGGIRGREGVSPGIGGKVGRSYQKLLTLPSGMMLISYCNM
jgi:hypothetical protein